MKQSLSKRFIIYIYLDIFHANDTTAEQFI